MRTIVTGVALLLAMDPARANDQGMMMGGLAAAGDIGALIQQVSTVTTESSADWLEDWQESVVLPTHDVSPYVPIDSLTPYVPARVDLAHVNDMETVSRTNRDEKGTLSVIAEKTSLEVGSGTSPAQPLHMFDTGEAFEIIDSRGRSIAYVFYRREGVRASDFLSPEDAKTFALTIVNMTAREAVARLSDY
jgi:hypothetical protein